MKKLHANDYRVPSGKKVDLGKWPTKVKPVYGSKEEYKSLLAAHIEKPERAAEPALRVQQIMRCW